MIQSYFMKFELGNPFNPSQYVAVSILMEGIRHEYVKQTQGLAFGRGGITISQPNNPVYRRVASNEQLKTPEMQRLLSRDGLKNYAQLRLGAEIVIEETPGITVALVEYMRYDEPDLLLSLGGMRTTTVDGKVVKKSFPQE